LRLPALPNTTMRQFFLVLVAILINEAAFPYVTQILPLALAGM
jgi:hypothetical protein